MKRRVFFKENSERRAFFSSIKLCNEHLNSNNRLSQYLGTSKSVMDNYLSGKLTLSENRFWTLIETLPAVLRRRFISKIEYKNANWGQIQGGRITVSRHKEIFAYGRQIANNKKRLLCDSYPNVKLSKELCEFIGAFIGDGFIGTYGGSYVFQITGDARFDHEYFHQKLLVFARNLFPNIKPHILVKENTIRLTFYSKALVLLFHKRFGFPLGKKCYTVEIPEEILLFGKEQIAATLRGLFDTDGCLFFDKRPKYKEPYMRIALDLCNKKLMKHIYSLLQGFGIKPTVTKDFECIQINGKQNVFAFIDKIGFSNERHLSKIRKISPRGELHPRPTAYEAVALAT